MARPTLRLSVSWVLAVAVCAGGGTRSFSSTTLGTPTLVAQSVNAEPLEKRVQAYWDRRQAKDLTGAYPFYCPAYRSRVSLAQFLRLTRLVRFDLQNVQVTRVVPKGDGMEVTVDYRFQMPTLPDQEAKGQAIQTWLRDTDAQWCKEDEPLILPFPSMDTPAPVAPPGGFD